MRWVHLIQSARTIVVLLLAGIGLAGIPDDLQAWWKWLAMLDECGIRIVFGLVAVLILVGPGYYCRFKKWKNEKDMRKHREHLLYMDAWEIVDFYIRDVIKDKPDRIKLHIRRGILEAFENTCSDGMKGEGVYDGNVLERWIQNNAIRMFVTHRGELRSENK